jgi:hypothetical protein
MNCCGNKRKEWMNEVKSSTRMETVENDIITANAEKSDKIFEYTGNHSLKITGLVSGNSYYFRFKGEKLKVKYIDSFALMAERDLRVSAL